MAFGLSAAILSPVIPPLLSHWGYETINLVLGCIALSVGLAASALIRFPEVGHGVANSPIWRSSRPAAQWWKP